MARISLSLVFVAVLAGSAIARPAYKAPVTAKITKAGHSSVLEVLAKDAARPPRQQSPAAVGSGTVTNELDTYVAPITVGSQTFNVSGPLWLDHEGYMLIWSQLIVDTGSSNTWVGAGTKFSAGTTGHSTGASVSVSYGSGSFSGTEYTDTVGRLALQWRTLADVMLA
jgi:hypothetical protein